MSITIPNVSRTDIKPQNIPACGPIKSGGCALGPRVVQLSPGAAPPDPQGGPIRSGGCAPGPQGEPIRSIFLIFENSQVNRLGQWAN